MSSSIKLTNANKWLLIIIFAPVMSVSFTSFIISVAQTAVAQESEEQVATEGSASEEAVFRRVEIWGLFYRLMVVAFVVGAVVQGTIIYITWRFRESNKKNQPREPWEGMHR
jgi:heme/copper-type cytochrome/quinol oxidase subunit 2